ncbi:hypothetical protein TrCOL_g3355 [Triparma columacea]|uniref:Uncharacterized protein n=1 Tax=Triparma columacea TaxID=722753 RepID=A0A9W7LBM6_9STRA|nr:hypothetical protein TrCOL_g3355 [Triparma columacea]
MPPKKQHSDTTSSSSSSKTPRKNSSSPLPLTSSTSSPPSSPPSSSPLPFPTVALRETRKRKKSSPPASDAERANAERLDRITRDSQKALGGGRGNLNVHEMRQHLTDVREGSVQDFYTYKKYNPEAPVKGELNYLKSRIEEWDIETGNQRCDSSFATIREAGQGAMEDALYTSQTKQPLRGAHLEFFTSIEAGIQPFPTRKSSEFLNLLKSLPEAGSNTEDTTLFQVSPSKNMTADILHTHLSKEYNLSSLLHEQHALIYQAQEAGTPLQDIENVFETVTHYIWAAGSPEGTVERVREGCMKLKKDAILDNENNVVTYMGKAINNKPGEMWVCATEGSSFTYPMCVSDARGKSDSELGYEFTLKTVELYGKGEIFVDILSDEEDKNIIATRDCLKECCVGEVHTSNPENPKLDLVFVKNNRQTRSREAIEYVDKDGEFRLIGRGRVCLAAMLGERHQFSLCQCEHADGIRSVCGFVMDCSKVMNVYLKSVRRGEGFYYWWSPWKKA